MAIDKNGKEITKNISYIFQYTDSTRFMATSLLNFVNKLLDIIHKIRCKFGPYDKKNVKNVELHISIASVFLNTQILMIL